MPSSSVFLTDHIVRQTSNIRKKFFQIIVIHLLLFERCAYHLHVRTNCTLDVLIISDSVDSGQTVSTTIASLSLVETYSIIV